MIPSGANLSATEDRNHGNHVGAPLVQQLSRGGKHHNRGAINADSFETGREQSCRVLTEECLECDCGDVSKSDVNERSESRLRLPAEAQAKRQKPKVRVRSRICASHRSQLNARKVHEAARHHPAHHSPQSFEILRALARHVFAVGAHQSPRTAPSKRQCKSHFALMIQLIPISRGAAQDELVCRRQV